MDRKTKETSFKKIIGLFADHNNMKIGISATAKTF